ncbi:MAG: hypothetical protein JO345_01905 [Streptosporangiaceae bacterium]|nr:hypothetical protein [Streptosporangiaceae bacterium]
MRSRRAPTRIVGQVAFADADQEPGPVDVAHVTAADEHAARIDPERDQPLVPVDVTPVTHSSAEPG